MFRFLIFSVFVFSIASHAQPDCLSTLVECKEDCLIEFGGSIRVEIKKRYESCVKKCSKTAGQCQERTSETKNNRLNGDASAPDDSDVRTTKRQNTKPQEMAPLPSEPPPTPTVKDDASPKKKEQDHEDLRNY